MIKLNTLGLLLVVSVYAPVVAASADASVQISSPAAGAKLKAGSPIPVTYDVMPGSSGDHTHIYVNGDQKGVLMKLKDTHTLDGLAAGKHDICIKIVSKGHAPIGIEKCVSVSVE
ncbi:MAG: hypothetical protein ABL860_00185 [Candidatus Nitrotoga sp.]